MLEELIGGNRWRPIAAAVAIIAAGVIAFVTIAGGSGSAHLPGPPHVVAAARASHPGASQSAQPDTFTPLDSPPLTSCSASVSNPAPPQGATAETVTVVSAAGAQVKVEADYSRTHSVHTTSADSTGKATLSLPISHASPGVTVPVKVTATLARAKVTCTSSFTPVGGLNSLGSLNLFPKVTALLPGAPALNQLPKLPPPTKKPPASPPPSSPPPPPPPPPPTTTTVPPTTTTTVPPTTTTTVPPTTTTTVPPTTTTTVPPTTTTTVPPTTTTTVPPTTTTTTTTLLLGL